jgi:hypothetical protein
MEIKHREMGTMFRRGLIAALMVFIALGVTVSGLAAENTLPDRYQKRVKSGAGGGVEEKDEFEVGRFIAVRSGQLLDGEQIPLPVYSDGAAARRSECQYIISPAEVPTALSYIDTSGSFYLKAYVDSDGFAHVGLWQQSGSGDGIQMVGSDSYEKVKKEFGQSAGYSVTGAENVILAQMRVLSGRVRVNYMVIAIRS